ncbi:MAG: hypothetical protein BWK79_04185 [Beggiatoa sp. IS2]|nr:MAG: hypothetical protein BWK79_04185 [Beggiatoa sp. IS2]
MVFLQNNVFAESSATTLARIQEKFQLIERAAEKLEITPKYLAAIIYTERTLNYDWTDETFDVIIAKRGLNSSIGFCQLKLKTAYFIERQFNEITSVFYPGKKFANLLQISQIPQELIDKLVNDSSNILYAAAYLRMMQTRWEKAGFPINDRPDILGTLYSTGLFYNDGTERQPNAHPKPNTFGIKVLESVKLF